MKKTFFAPALALLASTLYAAEETRHVLLNVPVFQNVTLRSPKQGESLNGTLGVFVKVKGRDTLLHLPIAANTCVSAHSDSPQAGASLQVRDNWFWCVLMKPDLEALKNVNAADIEKATLSFSAGWVENPGRNAKFETHVMLTAWEESATWGKGWRNGALAAGADFDAAPLATREFAEFHAGAVEIPGMAEAVAGWLSGKPNNGVMIRFDGGAMQANLVSRQEGGHTPDRASVRLGGGANAVFAFDTATLATLLIAPDDVRSAELRLRVVAGADTLPQGAEVEVFPLRVDAAALGMRPPRPGVDFVATRVGSAKMSELAEGVLKIPLSGDGIRAAGNKGFLVRAANAADGELAVGSRHADGNAPQFFAHLRAYPREPLFAQTIVPRPGVYVQAKDGHLDYGGERLRLWGVAMDPRNPEIAGRLRRIGFNSARLWGPNAGTFYGADTTTGLPAATIDVFHRAFAEMKKEGIFVDTTMLSDSVPISTADNSWLKNEGPADDWDAWREAWNTPNLSSVIKTFGASFDPRLMAARKRHITNVLTFKNPYTGKTYAEEECICLFELNNEQEHIRKMLESGFDEWPAYFRGKYQRQWNDWLRKKYPSGVAWELHPGESPAENSIALEPILARRGEYPAQRAADFIQFTCESVINFHKGLEAFARTFGPAVAVVPFSYDTQYKPSTHWLHTITSGDVANFGMYFWSLTSTLTAPPSLYVMDSHTVKGKPTFIYETNVGRPNPFRTEMPFRVAAFATHQDWDAVYWHYYMGVNYFPDVPDEQYLAVPVRYMWPDFYWTAVEFENDALLQSSISLAGQIFLRALLPPAKNPVVYTVPADSLYSYETFNGINTTRAAFEHGAMFDLRPDLPGKTSIAGADPEVLQQRLAAAVASGEHVIWDWPNGRLLIDAPGVKVYTGKPSGVYRFKDGIAFNTLDGEFITLALVSSDNLPLLETKAPIYFTALNDAQNTGFAMNTAEITRPNGIHIPPDLQARNITSHGHAPVVYTPAPFQLLWPKTWTGNAAAYDFALRKTGASPLAANVFQRYTPPPWINLLTITAATTPQQTPATTLAPALQATARGDARPPSETLQPSAISHQTYNPLPHLSWDDGYFAAHKILRDGALIIGSISPEDNTQNANKSLTLFNAEAIPGTAADIEVAFAQNKMSRITITFTQPLALTAILAHLETKLGPAAQKSIADAAHQTTTVTWPPKAGLRVELKEAQGVQTVTFNRAP